MGRITHIALFQKRDETLDRGISHLHNSLASDH